MKRHECLELAKYERDNYSTILEIKEDKYWITDSEYCDVCPACFCPFCGEKLEVNIKRKEKRLQRFKGEKK